MAQFFSPENFNKILNQLESSYGQNSLVQSASKATGQRPAHVIVGGIGLVVFLILVIFGIETVSDLLLILPIYASMKALKSSDKKDDSQWLTYWVLVGVVFVVEELTEDLFLEEEDERSSNVVFLGFLYYLSKIVFFLWAADHNTRGASMVYEKGLLPVFNKVEALIEGKSS